MLDGVALLFTDAAAMRGFLGVDGLDDSSPFETELDKAVHQLPLEAPVPRLLARRIAGLGSRGFNDPIAAETLNAASAACGDNFFISRSAADGASLSGLIGQRSAKVIETSVAEALSDSRPRDVVTDYIPSVTGTQSDASFAFSLTCAGLLDADMTSQIGEIIKTIVGELPAT